MVDGPRLTRQRSRQLLSTVENHRADGHPLGIKRITNGVVTAVVVPKVKRVLGVRMNNGQCTPPTTTTANSGSSEEDSENREVPVSAAVAVKRSMATPALPSPKRTPSVKRSKPANTTPAPAAKKGKPSLASRPASSATGVLTVVKAAFNRALADQRIIGRAAERAKMVDFWQRHVHAGKPGALYISGQPGTGKTALLNEVQRQMTDKDVSQSTSNGKQSVRVVQLNCMTVVEPKDIYARLLDELPASALTGLGQHDNDPMLMLRELVLNERRKTLVVVVLDEIDHLLTNKDQDVLYRLFEWAVQPTSRLVLIGIANALDLTERFLPMLRSKQCEPELLHFNPYSVTEIVDILGERLRVALAAASVEIPAGTPPPMQRAAIELCARKVASVNGDLRKAMDVCRCAVELAEQDFLAKQKQRTTPVVPALSDITTAKANASNPTLASTPAPRPTVSIAHVLKALSGAFGSAAVQVMRGLGFQSKLALAAFLHHSETNQGRRGATIGQLHDTYLALCQTQRTLTPVTRSEFYDLIGMLEAANGLVAMTKQRTQRTAVDRTQQVQLNAQPDEIRLAFRDQPLLLGLLSNVKSASIL